MMTRKKQVFQWKMSFNPGINKQVQKVIFSCKHQKSNHSSLVFDGTSVTLSEIQKHLGMFLDSKLDFKEHLVNQLGYSVHIEKKLQRTPLITIFYKASTSWISLWRFLPSEIGARSIQCCISDNMSYKRDI